MSKINEIAVTHDSYLELQRRGEGTEKSQMLEWLTIAHIDSTRPQVTHGKVLVVEIPLKSLERWGLITGQHVSRSIRRLHDQVCKIKISLEHDGRFGSVVAFPMIEYVHDKSLIEVSIMSPLAPYLTELHKNFSKFQLKILFGELDSMWARKMYLIWKNHYPLTEPLEISIDDLKARLGVEGKYERWDNFRRKILDPALKEVNSEKRGCDINVSYEYLKTGKKVTHLIFKISDNSPKQESLGISPATSNLTAQTHALLDEIKWTSHQKFFFEDLSVKVEPKIIEKALKKCIDENDTFRNSKGFAGRIRNTFMQTLESVMQVHQLQKKSKNKAAEQREKQEELEKEKQRTEELADKYILENKAALYSQLTAMEKQFWTVDDVPDSALRPYALEALKINQNG